MGPPPAPAVTLLGAAVLRMLADTYKVNCGPLSRPVAAQVETVDPHLALVIKTKQRKIIHKKARNNVRVQDSEVSGTMNKYAALGYMKLTWFSKQCLCDE